MGISKDNALVATGRSPNGQPVPLREVQHALDVLAQDGQVAVDVATLGHRSAFCGAVLKTIAGVRCRDGTPPILGWRNERNEFDPTAEDRGALKPWWESSTAERYWMEITDRPDIGTDLHCPQRDSVGKANSGYSTILFVQDGDTILHYDRNKQAVTSWSQAVGRVGAAPTHWASHRGATRLRLGTELRKQPGWWLDLEGPFLLDEPVDLRALRAHGNQILTAINELAATHGSVYAPFYGYGTDHELRPAQYYLNKLPAAVLELIGGPQVEAGPDHVPLPGVTWRAPTVSESVDRRREVEVDVEVVERGLRGHVDTETALAAALQAHGITPLSPGPGDPNFDIAWRTENGLAVAEIKSITPSNEERQLRLGLGQVLRYRSQLASRTDLPVHALLVPEREPTDPSWTAVCAEVGVQLVPGPQIASKLTVPSAPSLVTLSGSTTPSLATGQTI